MGRIWKIIGGTLLFMILFYGALALIPPRPIRYMDDHTLRDYALSYGLAPIPDNPLSAYKVALGQRLFLDSILSGSSGTGVRRILADPSAAEVVR